MTKKMASCWSCKYLGFTQCCDTPTCAEGLWEPDDGYPRSTVDEDTLNDFFLESGGMDCENMESHEHATD